MTQEYNPLTPLPTVELISRADEEASAEIPELKQFVSAGIPMPGSDQMMDGYTDIHDMLIENPVATYFMRVHGHYLDNAGIHDKDILIVDRVHPFVDGDTKFVVAAVKGELCIKKVYKQGDQLYLIHPYDKMESFELKPKHKFEIWGFIIYNIHKV